MATRVLVTGASGFIAQHVILALLAKGYEICGTLRSLRRADEVRNVLARHSDRGASIDLFEADLNSEAGWAQAVAGCDYVQHVASPFPASHPSDANELIRPARDGALRVLKAARSAGVKRVVMTSSLAAVMYGHGENRPAIADESHWSDPDGADNTPYTQSKTLAERAAWEFIKEGQGLELVTINPGAVLGPALSADVSTSLEIPIRLLNGKTPGLPRLGFTIVDVRDVAACHVAAMEVAEAAGERFIATDDFMWMSECAEVLRAAFPAYGAKIPKRQIPDWVVKLMAVLQPVYRQTVTELSRTRRASSAKAARMLGVTFRPAREALLASAQSLIDLKVV